MNRDDIDRHIDSLKTLQERLPEDLAAELFRTRRAFERSYHDYIKTGDTVRVVKPRAAHCPSCSFHAQDPDHLYLHLRKNHKFKEADAAEVCSNQISTYDADLEKLRELLAEYTDHLLPDSYHEAAQT